MNTLKIFVTGVLDENAYILFDDQKKHASVIDPGDDAGEILDFISNKKLELISIVLTHGHWDHIGAVQEIRNKTKVKIAIHADDASFLQKPEYNLGGSIIPVEADILLKDAAIVPIGSAHYRVIHTPGHTPGGVCYFGEGKLFSGDTLFYEGIGRSDLPGGNYEQLAAGVRQKLFVLPEQTQVFPGHGPSTTIGWEKRHNSFD